MPPFIPPLFQFPVNKMPGGEKYYSGGMDSSRKY
jgi:hypothetical protein